MNVELFKSSKTSAGQVHLRQLLEIIKVTSLGALQVSLGRTLPPSSEMAAVNCSTSSFSTGRCGEGGVTLRGALADDVSTPLLSHHPHCSTTSGKRREIKTCVTRSKYKCLPQIYMLYVCTYLVVVMLIRAVARGCVYNWQITSEMVMSSSHRGGGGGCGLPLW